MDIPARSGTFPASMKTAPIAVAFSEVRHFKPDDWLHFEPIAVRGQLHDWTIPAHRHEGLHRFQWLARGRAAATLDGVVQELRAPALAARLPATLVLQGDVVREQAERVAALFSALAAESADHAPSRNEALRAHLVLLVTWCLRQALPVPPDEARRALRDTLVQRFRALAELHLRRHQPLGFYAGALQVTPDHLSRSCRAVTGLSALDLLHERLLLEARRLLAYTQAPVAEVARELGFDDPAYFSRFFARRDGRAPLDYRAALQMGQAVPP